MPIASWPAQDRELWRTACAPAALLSEQAGSRSDRRPISNRKSEKGYGRYLTYLTLFAPECLAEPAAARITPERVKAYIEHLKSLNNSTATILARLQELGEAAKVMGPTRSWQFINEIASRIRARHVPARDKSNLKLTDELLDLGLALMERVGSQEGWPAAVQYRDGLIIAFLALVPLRRRNIEGILLGKNLIEVRGRWIIVLDNDETKTHAAYELDLPDLLVEPLRTYLSVYRPMLAARNGRWAKAVGDALWVSKDGSPMTQMAIYDRVRARTRMRLAGRSTRTCFAMPPLRRWRLLILSTFVWPHHCLAIEPSRRPSATTSKRWGCRPIGGSPRLYLTGKGDQVRKRNATD